MTSYVHPTAVIDPSAQLGESVEIGPYVIIGPHCTVGSGTKLLSHVVLESHTRLGENCQVASGAILGGLPQDYTFGNETSWVDIGNNVTIREYVTVNRATGEDEVTRVGDHSMIMAYSHVAHNCRLGEHVTLANNVQLAGYVDINDKVFISGTFMAHQFVKIGRLSFVCPFGGTRQDIPPFAMTEGRPQATVVGINKVGLKRAGFSLEERNRIKRAYHHLFFSRMNTKNAVAAVREEVTVDANVEELLQFVLNSKRGIHRPDDAVVAARQAEVSESGNPVEV